MKNAQYTLDAPLPKEVRLECFKEAIEYYKRKINGLSTKNKGRGLCLALPSILWDLDSYLGNPPHIEEWHCLQTPKAFVFDLSDLLLKLQSVNSSEKAFKVRIKFLEKLIKDLENE